MSDIGTQNESSSKDATQLGHQGPATVEDPALLLTTVRTCPDEPYSIYTKREKWFILCMVAVAGFYSPLPANIYFPAIPTLSKEFGNPSKL